MILFLDFDGVLHPMPAGDAGLFSRAPLLWQLLKACQTIEIVFSTSWREAHEFDLLVDFATHGGIEGDITHRFLGATPELDRLREDECRAWMQANRPGGDWIALDDNATMFKPGCPNLHLVNYTTGLTDEDVAALQKRIKGK
jgi:hypothetical protein